MKEFRRLCCKKKQRWKCGLSVVFKKTSRRVESPLSDHYSKCRVRLIKLITGDSTQRMTTQAKSTKNHGLVNRRVFLHCNILDSSVHPSHCRDKHAQAKKEKNLTMVYGILLQSVQHFVMVSLETYYVYKH